jgi:hypothetical protein
MGTLGIISIMHLAHPHTFHVQPLSPALSLKQENAPLFSTHIHHPPPPPCAVAEETGDFVVVERSDWVDALAAFLVRHAFWVSFCWAVQCRSPYVGSSL